MPIRDDLTCVKVEIDDEGIAWVTFNRPEKRNAMNPTLHYEMEEVLMALETDSAAKVIVITGAGNSWSAGIFGNRRLLAASLRKMNEILLPAGVYTLSCYVQRAVAGARAPLET